MCLTWHTATYQPYIMLYYSLGIPFVPYFTGLSRIYMKCPEKGPNNTFIPYFE